MSKTTLSESTMKKLLKLSGLSEFEDEVLLENKKSDKKPLKESSNSEKSEKKEKPEENMKKDSYKKDNKKLNKLTELNLDDEDLDEAPVGEVEGDEGMDLPDEDFGDVEGDTDATVDFDKFAAEFADLLSKYSGATFTIQKDGADLSPVSESEFETAPVGEEDELTDTDLDNEMPSDHTEPDEDNFGGEGEGLEGSEELPSDKLKESKTKKVSELVFEAVLKKLAAKSGIDLDKARKAGKVQVKLDTKKKKLNEVFSSKPQRYEPKVTGKTKKSKGFTTRGANELTQFDAGARFREDEFGRLRKPEDSGKTQVLSPDILKGKIPGPKSSSRKRVENLGAKASKELGKASPQVLDRIVNSQQKIEKSTLPQPVKTAAAQALQNKRINHETVADVTFKMQSLIGKFDIEEILDPRFEAQFDRMLEYNARNKGWDTATFDAISRIGREVVKAAKENESLERSWMENPSQIAPTDEDE